MARGGGGAGAIPEAKPREPRAGVAMAGCSDSSDLQVCTGHATAIGIYHRLPVGTGTGTGTGTGGAGAPVPVPVPVHSATLVK